VNVEQSFTDVFSDRKCLIDYVNCSMQLTLNLIASMPNVPFTPVSFTSLPSGKVQVFQQYSTLSVLPDVVAGYHHLRVTRQIIRGRGRSASKQPDQQLTNIGRVSSSSSPTNVHVKRLIL